MSKKKAKEVTNWTKESFLKPHNDFTLENPRVFNGVVNVRRWRITVELIDESPEVIYARLLDLWERSDNYHDMLPLQKAAQELGMTLPSNTFSKRMKEKT
jgi:hypothetical protein